MRLDEILVHRQIRAWRQTLLYSANYESPIGGLELTGDGTTLTGLYFANELAGGRTAELVNLSDLPVFAKTARWLDAYFSSKPLPEMPELNAQGSDFQRKIWTLLLKIPSGKTVTYGQLAADYCRTFGAETMSARAVGGAVGRNPISIIVPCHRVVGAGGRLTGYASGVEHKIALLNIEGVNVRESAAAPADWRVG